MSSHWSAANQGNILLTEINAVCGMVSNYNNSFMWNVIPCPSTVVWLEVGACVSNDIHVFCVDVVTHPCPKHCLISVSKRDPRLSEVQCLYHLPIIPQNTWLLAARYLSRLLQDSVITFCTQWSPYVKIYPDFFSPVSGWPPVSCQHGLHSPPWSEFSVQMGTDHSLCCNRPQGSKYSQVPL